MRAILLALVAERSGMIFAANRLVEADAGIARAMKHAGEADPASYVSLVRRDPAALDRLVDELTVGETHFMRDPAQMELIRTDVLPALAERRRKGGLPPRVWSAGCATGEEAYTLAILLEEAGLAEGAVVLGTDLSAAALEKARQGSYSDWSMRGVSADFLRQNFRHVAGRRLLAERTRGRVRFCALNLVDATEYATSGAMRMDLVLCRNVLIYFDRDTAARVAARLYDCLAEGGVLLTAAADRHLGAFAPFDVEVTRAGLVYRRGRGHARERPVIVEASVHGRPPEATRPATSAHPRPPPSPPAPHASRRDEAFEQVVLVANGIGAFEAEVMAHAAVGRHPLDAPLHYLRATLLLALDRDAEADEETRRALYLDPSLALAHFLLGTLRRRHGARREALRAFRNARDLCVARPPQERLSGGSGELVGALASAASAEIEILEVSVA